jgi:hypothetical protein
VDCRVSQATLFLRKPLQDRTTAVRLYPYGDSSQEPTEYKPEIVPLAPIYLVMKKGKVLINLDL